MTVDITQADVIEWAKTYDGPKFMALLADPPYELNFMGKNWDKSGIAFNPDTWAALAEHLYPGAFGMCFASSRGWHRLAVAIEDAGMIILPSIFGWGNGQSFPKATRVKDVSGFEGHRYGGQVLKNALEPIIVFQKPYEGKPVDNITTTGAGAMWVDGSRINLNGEKPPSGSGDRRGGLVYAQDEYTQTKMANGGNVTSPQGRWPANLILDCDCDTIDWCTCDDCDHEVR